MGQANGYVLRLSKDREEVFKECVDMGDTFGQPVPDFLHSRAVPLICFIMSRENKIATLAQGRRGVKGGTGLRRLNVSEAMDVRPAIPIRDIETHVARRHRQ